MTTTLCKPCMDEQKRLQKLKPWWKRNHEIDAHAICDPCFDRIAMTAKTWRQDVFVIETP